MVQTKTEFVKDEDGFFNIGLDDILVIDLNRALKENDPNIIMKGMIEEEMRSLMEEFHAHCQTSVSTPTERKIKFHSQEYRFLTTMAQTLDYCYLRGLTSSLLGMGYKVKMGKDNNKDNVKYLFNKAMASKEDLEINIATNEKQKPLSSAKASDNIYSSIASLSIASGIKFDSKTTTALEFCSYIHALEEKNNNNNN